MSQSSSSAVPSPPVIRFAGFEVDVRAREIWKNGIKVKLQNQPFQILQMLLERPGEVVTREEIRSRIWPADTFVDFEHSVNTAVKKLRQALGDRPENPVFIETLPRQGFRFIASVHEPATAVPTSLQVPDAPPGRPRQQRRKARWLAVAGAILLAIVFGTAFILTRMSGLRTMGFSPNTVRSIAVLPLVNLSSDPNQDYFSEGMTSELITDLARLNKLQVISHTSVRRYKETKRPLPEIARELGVDAVVEGTVMRSGTRARITVQLIDARTDRHVWAESYDRDVRDILSLQAELAQQIATEVGIHLTASEQARLANNRVVDPAAHEAYLKGEFYWNRLNCAGFRQGLAYFQEAVNKDPSFVPAYSGIGASYFILADWGCMPQAEAFPKSKEAALQAVRLDPLSSDAHNVLGELAFYYEWDWTKAEKEFKQAIELDTNYADAHASYAIYLTSMGRREEGFAEIRKAQQLDPVSEMTNIVNAYVSYLAHRYDEAIVQAKKTLELYPRSGAAYYWLGQCYERKGMEQQAFAAYWSPPPASDPKDAHRGNPPQSLREYWQQKLENQAGDKSVGACWQAQTSAHLGNKERTLQLLEWNYQHHCDGLQFLKVEPIYDDLQADARYKSLLSRLGL